VEESWKYKWVLETNSSFIF